MKRQNGARSCEDSQKTVTSSEMQRAEDIARPFLEGKKIVRFNTRANEVYTQQVPQTKSLHEEGDLFSNKVSIHERNESQTSYS